MQARLSPLQLAHLVQAEVLVDAIEDGEECHLLETRTPLQNFLAECNRLLALIGHGTDNTQSHRASQQSRLRDLAIGFRKNLHIPPAPSTNVRKFS
jgi:hypothetical protein